MQQTSANKHKLRSIIGSNIGAIMEKIYSEVTISMSEFKKNPAAVLRDAKSRLLQCLTTTKRLST